ncbi:MAG TPA: zf-HC2 domain-containing protein [Thermoanaerobaculia bacterium]|nr:zf-HC2 domain-containing protein [Thermoanaerobaculia bacterium]
MHAMTNCPSDETLAVFVEGKLKGAEREAVVAHLADCADCRDIVVDATEEAATANVVWPKSGWRKYAPPLIAAAAALAIVLGVPSIRERILGNELREVNESFAMRQTAGRLSIDDKHRPHKPVLRGGKIDPDLQAQITAEKALTRADAKPTQKNLHEAGLALLLAGKRGEAVEMLDRALQKGESVDLLNDAAAAHIAFGAERNLQEALELSERSLRIERTPEGLWNRALALEYLGRLPDAVSAWQEYQAAEPDPAWDADAQDHIKRLL